MRAFSSYSFSKSAHKYSFSPYEFVFTINCDSSETRVNLTRYIDYAIGNNSNDFYIKIAQKLFILYFKMHITFFDFKFFFEI